MKKIFMFLVTLPLALIGEDLFEGESPDGDFEFSLDGQACYDYMDNKGWSEGDNKTRKGTVFYAGVGVDSTGASMQQTSYIDGIQNAFIRAQLNAKTAIAEAQA